MAFKQAYTSLLVTIACCTVLSMATPLSYLRDNDQNGSPFGNQNQGFLYLRDNGVNQQAVYPVQSGPVNVVNNVGNSQILGTSQVQTIGSYPGVISNVGYVGNSGFGTNIINNVNEVNGLTTIQSPLVTQVPYVSYPGVQQVLPVSQYAVQQPAIIGAPVGYSNTIGAPVGYSNTIGAPVGYSNTNQVTNNQVAPVEVNFSSGQGCLGSPYIY